MHAIRYRLTSLLAAAAGLGSCSSTHFALPRGEPMPEWNVTAARGIPLEHSRIADFRGKWLLVEFWGYW